MDPFDPDLEFDRQMIKRWGANGKAPLQGPPPASDLPDRQRLDGLTDAAFFAETNERCGSSTPRATPAASGRSSYPTFQEIMRGRGQSAPKPPPTPSALQLAPSPWYAVCAAVVLWIISVWASADPDPRYHDGFAPWFKLGAGVALLVALGLGIARASARSDHKAKVRKWDDYQRQQGQVAAAQEQQRLSSLMQPPAPLPPPPGGGGPVGSDPVSAQLSKMNAAARADYDEMVASRKAIDRFIKAARAQGFPGAQTLGSISGWELAARPGPPGGVPYVATDRDADYLSGPLRGTSSWERSDTLYLTTSGRVVNYHRTSVTDDDTYDTRTTEYFNEVDLLGWSSEAIGYGLAALVRQHGIRW